MTPKAVVFDIGRVLIHWDPQGLYIAAAEARGRKVDLFTDPKGWAERLVTEGLLAPAEAR